MGRRRVQGSAATDTAHAPTTIPTSALAHNPRNPRIDYDDVQELAESLREYGVLQPLGVIRYEVFLGRFPEFEREVGSAHWVVIQGNRRLAAARQAELDEVPVIVHDRVGHEDVFDESSLVENVHRKDLPPLQEAALLRELLDKHGSQRKLATKLKKSQSYISQRLSLFDLVPTLQEEVTHGDLGFAAARELAGLPREHQVAAYAAGPPYRLPSNAADHDVISSPAPASPHVATAEGGDGAAHPETFTEPDTASASEPVRTRRATFPTPATLAPQIREQYTRDQRTELARLLLE